MGICFHLLYAFGIANKESVVDGQGCVINICANIIKCANLGMEVTHECNTHNLPLDLALQ